MISAPPRPRTARSGAGGSEPLAPGCWHADATRVVLSGDDRRLPVEAPWPVRMRTRDDGRGGTASIEHDLLSIYTNDPYLGGCTKLVRLSDVHDDGLEVVPGAGRRASPRTARGC